MRNSLIICLLSLASASNSWPQTHLLFQTKIYIRDAKGNVDSMTIGIDTSLATHGPILDTPFDSVLEIRGAVYNEIMMYDPPPKLSKNVVTLAEMPIFTNGEAKYPLAAPIEFFIWAKYLPITLSWDRNDWDQYSLSGSFLVPHWFYQTIPQWHQNPFLDDYACMAYDSDFTTSFNEIWESEKIATTWYRPWEIEGLGIDTLQILELAPKYKYAFLNPCFGSGTNDEVIALFGLKVYPTITEDNVNIYAETQFEKIEVYNFQGQLEQSFEGNEVNISLRDLSSGYKVLMLYHHSSRPIAIRVLKV